jgi:hypothetical protein
MEQAPGLFSIGTESHIAIESIPAFHPGNRLWHSNRLTAEEAATPAARRLADSFYSELRDRDGRRPDGPARMLEKTPKNALRIPFFAALWPDSTFIYLYRDVRQTLASAGASAGAKISESSTFISSASFFSSSRSPASGAIAARHSLSSRR